MARVTGIGGVFIKSNGDNAALAAWYHKNLGLTPEAWGGVILQWAQDKANDGGLTVWHTAKADSQWFAPSTATFMINYRVDDLDEMLAQMRANGVEIHQGPDSEDNGKFAWVIDPDGNKVELWEPKAMEEKEGDA